MVTSTPMKYAVAQVFAQVVHLNGVPLEIQAFLDRERAWAALQRDKKQTGGELTLVLLGDEGGYTASVPAADVRAALDELIAN